jgi:bacterial/archaeal transporter family protein
MKWVFVVIGVVASTAGDLLTAKCMAMHGELHDFSPRGIRRILGYLVTHRLIIIGTACNAIAFFAFIALLSVEQVSFAVPATALSYVLKTVLAKTYLKECVTWKRWAGAFLVAAGVVFVLL